MSVLSSCRGTMLCSLMSLWVLMMSLVHGLSGLGLLRLHLVLLVGPLLGGYQCLDMLLVWLLLILGLLRVSRLRVHDVRYTGLVVLDQDGREFDWTENTPHLVSFSFLRHVCGREMRHVGLSVGSSADKSRRRYGQRDDGYVLVQNRTGVG